MNKYGECLNGFVDLKKENGVGEIFTYLIVIFTFLVTEV